MGVCVHQGVAVAFGVAAGVDFFGFEDKVAAFVAVHAAVAFAAVAVPFFERALKHVVLVGRGMGPLDPQQFTQFEDETLRGGQFAASSLVPALDECFGVFFVCFFGVHDSDHRLLKNYFLFNIERLSEGLRSRFAP